MNLNKTLASALLLSVVLTGCDNMVKNENNDANAPVVEENTAENANEAQNTDDDVQAPAETTENTADNENAEENNAGEEATENAEQANTEENSDEANNETASTSTEGMTTEQKVEALEQAIFDNRSSARAVEILFELSPETANAHADQLNELLDNSNSLLERAQSALDQLKAQ
ncbi:hypothetical protein ACCQ41_05560 [Anaerococcus sp. ENR0831]|uniref:Lipoprotein n=1 Tax=Anaerococcus martiniensis TaxID=3115615 RepID=A0ABW9M9R1_9FIRM